MVPRQVLRPAIHPLAAAEGKHPQPFQRVHRVLIIRVCHNEPIRGRQFGELTEGIFNIRQVLKEIQMV